MWEIRGVEHKSPNSGRLVRLNKYGLINSISRIFSQKLRSSQLAKKFHAYHEAKKKLHGVIYNSQPFVLVQDQIIPLQNRPLYFFKIYINIIS